MRTIERDIVGGLIFSSDGKILLGRMDPVTKVYAGYWVIPGGGVEPGESQLEALQREMLEETGIDIRPYPAELVDVATGESEKTLAEMGERVLVKMTFYDYLVRIIDRDAATLGNAPTEELIEIAWADVAELPEYKLSPPTEELLTKLGYLSV